MQPNCNRLTKLVYCKVYKFVDYKRDEESWKTFKVTLLKVMLLAVRPHCCNYQFFNIIFIIRYFIRDLSSGLHIHFRLHE